MRWDEMEWDEMRARSRAVARLVWTPPCECGVTFACRLTGCQTRSPLFPRTAPNKKDLKGLQCLLCWCHVTTTDYTKQNKVILIFGSVSEENKRPTLDLIAVAVLMWLFCTRICLFCPWSTACAALYVLLFQKWSHALTHLQVLLNTKKKG